jgi:hypothetical protein
LILLAVLNLTLTIVALKHIFINILASYVYIKRKKSCSFAMIVISREILCSYKYNDYLIKSKYLPKIGFVMYLCRSRVVAFIKISKRI